MKCLLIAAGMTLFACSRTPSADGRDSIRASSYSIPIPIASKVDRSRPTSSGAEFSGVLIESPAFTQSLEGLGSKVVRFITEETSPQGSTSSRSIEISSSFTVLRVKARSAVDWLVLGGFDDGSQVLERWLVTAPSGAIQAERPVSSAPIGTSVPGLIPTTLQVQGGTYIPPEERTPQEPAQRVRVHALAEGTRVLGFDVDPDGRFALHVTPEPAGLYQVAMLGDAEPVLLFDRTQIPKLAKTKNVQAWQHATYGRVYTLNFAPDRTLARTLLVDANNDGVFEQIVTLTKAEFDAGFTAANIVDDFTHF